MDDKKPSEVEPRAAAMPTAVMVGALAWVLPGAGHMFLGRRGRGAAFLVLVLIAMGVGLAIDGELPDELSGSPLLIIRTLGCMGAGLPYFMVRLATDYGGDPEGSGFEYGKAFIVTAGVMNLLLVLDAWDIARGRKT